MLIFVSSLCRLLIALSFVPFSRACKAPQGTNFTEVPRYWCSLDARISVTTMCHAEVEEVITVPWSIGMIDRFVPTDENQRIEDLTAYRLVNGQRISTYSAIRRERLPGNVLLSVRAKSTPGPVTIMIKYKKIGAVQIFSRCSGITDFKQVSSSLDSTVMITKWAVGGRSLAELYRLRIEFVLARHQNLQYIDTLTMAGEAFNAEIDNPIDDTDKSVGVIYGGSAAGMIPSELFFYIRFIMRFGAQTCPSSRSCEDEDLIIKEGRILWSNHKVILGLTLGLGFLVIIISIVVWVCCCKWLRAKEPDLDVDGIPESLRHFTVDTADEQQRKTREEWTETSPKSSEMKEEFYALDLSPRSRGKKGSDGF